MRVVHVELAALSIPFRFAFAHAAASRGASDSIVLTLMLDNGVTGYGECLARRYVTGETPDDVCAWIATHGLPFLSSIDLHGRESLNELITCPNRGVLDVGGAAGCLLELALIDTFGKAFRTRVPEIFGRPEHETTTYAGVVGNMNGIARRMLLRRMGDAGITHLKVKVGFGASDEAALEDCRRVLGPDVLIGVDANGAWSPDEALAAIGRLHQFGIDFVEQPTARDDRAGLALVTKESPIAIVLDESICSLDDAEGALEGGLGVGVSVRVSKVGGIRGALQLHDFAREHGWRYHVGALVGETGILAAAGRHLAVMTRPAMTEGSFGDLLLAEDITEPSVRFGRRGIGRRIAGFGLGVSVVAERLTRYATGHMRFEPKVAS